MELQSKHKLMCKNGDCGTPKFEYIFNYLRSKVVSIFAHEFRENKSTSNSNRQK